MSSQAENNIQVPLVVMNQLLTELKNANEKFERVVELGSSVAGIESAVKGLTERDWLAALAATCRQYVWGACTHRCCIHSIWN
jgi:hypothetical protein